MLGLIATLERRVLQTRVKMGMRERSRKGLWHRRTPPFGYTYDGQTGKLKLDPEEREVVTEAFCAYLSTRCVYATRDALTSKGHKTRTGKPWSVPGVRRILSRDTDRGFLTSSGVTVRDESVVLVSDEVFEEAQKYLSSEKPREKGRQIMKHQFARKRGIPSCPQCSNTSTVRRRGKRTLLSGLRKCLYYCNLCCRTFDEATSLISIPLCPKCLRKDRVQYFRQRTAAYGLRFKVFGCRFCSNRFRIISDQPGRT
ncbi:MAG: recombinase family protein [bacterium]